MEWGRFSPFRSEALRSVFLKSDNFMEGRYFAEVPEGPDEGSGQALSLGGGAGIDARGSEGALQALPLTPQRLRAHGT